MSVADEIGRIADLIERRELDLAAAQAQAVREAFPGEAEPARLHGIALLLLQRPREACAAFERAIELAPRMFETYCNLSSAQLAANDAQAAMRAVERALAVVPANAVLWNALANACRAAGDHVRARNVYRAALAQAPTDLNIRLNLAATEMTLGELNDAERLVREVLAQTPAPNAWLLLGHILKTQRRYEPAREAYARGGELAPRDALYVYHRGLMDEELHRFESAHTEYAHALQLDPRMLPAIAELAFVKRRICDWQGLDALSLRLHEEVARGNPDVQPFSFLAEDSTAQEQLACARAQAQRVIARTGGLAMPASPSKLADAPLRVGFVSAGFHAHASGVLVAGMFEELCKLDLEVQLFATSSDDGSNIRRRLQAAAHAFHDVSAQVPFEIARAVRSAGIDILVDMDVWCGGGVPHAFALRPAPIQVNWLGYPGSSGAAFIDYIVVDRFVLPESAREHYSESIAYLPRCYQPTDTTRELREPPPRAAFHLPDEGVVFACFNNGYKLNPASFARLCAVLRGVPASVLWLLDPGRAAGERLRAAARDLDVDPLRLVISPKLPHEQHIARHAHVDLFLDTHPYNAHTTASDALWAGCPVLTCPGDTFAARVAGSLNHHLGMEKLNMRSDEAFISTAIALANDPSALAALRVRLQRRKRESGLFDMQGYASDFAALLRAMWERRRNGLPPAHIMMPESKRED